MREFNLFEKMIFVTQCESTNHVIKELAKDDMTQITRLIYTDFQFKGRGQSGSYWESEKSKNLLLSFNIFPLKLQAQDQFYISIAVSLSLLDIIKKYILDKEVKIKWPNDIYVENKKIAGVLIENILESKWISKSVIGVGLNVNQVQFSDWIPNPTSLKINTKKTIAVQDVLGNFKQSFEKKMKKINQHDFEELKTDYLAQLYQINKLKKYRIKSNIVSGIIWGVDEYGCLKIEINNKLHSFDTKEVSYL